MAKNKITVILIKTGFDYNGIIKNDLNIQHENVDGHDFYYKSSNTATPKWVANFFVNGLEFAEQLKSASAMAVLLVKINFREDDERVFAISFGYGRNLLNPNCIEERFGLITTLNSINANMLRSINYRNIDSVPLSGQVQSSKLGGIENFDVDINRDFLKSATGNIDVENLGKTMTGADSLTFSAEADINNIEDILRRCYEKYKSQAYMEHFGWINNLHLIKDNGLISSLNQELLKAINEENTELVWMSIPDTVDWEIASHFRLTKNDDNHHDDIFIEEVIPQVYNGHVDNVEGLKNHYVYLCDANDDIVKKWNYFKCLNAELDYLNKKYILDSGAWVEVAPAFNQTVEDFFNGINISDLNMVNYVQREAEATFNIRLANSDESFWLMDRKNIPTGQAGSTFEFCDVYTQARQMIHVKKYGSSSVISHLFNQGLVSGMNITDSAIRHRVNERMDEDWHLPEDNTFFPSNYEVVYVIISRDASPRPHIPFFSKVVLMNNAKTLMGYGYKISLKNVHGNV